MGFFDILAAPFTAPTQGAMNIIGGVTGQSAADANEANAAAATLAFERSQGSADKQMAFQERMSNSAYSRAMQDMKNAGLNPMLAFSQGGASVPSGASASAVASTNQDVGAAALNNISNLAKGAKEGATLPSALAQMKAQTEQTAAQTAQTEAITPVQKQQLSSQAQLNSAAASRTEAEAAEIRARTKNYEPQQREISQRILNLVKEGKLRDLDAEEKGRLMQWLREHPYHYDAKQIMDHLNPLKGLFK